LKQNIVQVLDITRVSIIQKNATEV